MIGTVKTQISCRCGKPAVGFFKFIEHSKVYAGLVEIDNEIQEEPACEYHLEKATKLKLETRPILD